MTKNILIFLLLLTTTLARAQFGSLSPGAQISILTIGPGTELYDKFGHSAFRIKDSLSGVDVVFNYGVYDFDTPNFYTKFAQGKLLYQLGVSYYQPFFENYVAQNRWVKEQVLNLTQKEEQAVSDFLWKNALPENKNYKYDFFYDNCATKIRDVLILVLGDKLEYHEEHITTHYTFRELIQKNLDANTWGSLGIDVALGAVIDRQAKPFEYQFLPEYVFKGAAHATVVHNGKAEPLVKRTRTLFENQPVPNSGNFFSSPLFVLGLVALLIILVTLRDFTRRTRSRFLDGGIFFFTGLIGIFLALLWFATDHTATANNYNMLWAFPISVLLVVAISRRKIGSIIRRYALLLVLLLALLVLHWVTGVQAFAMALIPLLVALAVRYLFLLFHAKRQR